MINAHFHVMVVDDEKNIRDGLGKFLEMDGHEVFLAENGQDAWERTSQGDIDLIITDLKMPEMSGEELLKRISSAYPNIPVIILTGHGTIENAVETMRNGAYDFLTKPVNLDHLSLLVKRALSSRSLALEHRALQEEVERLQKQNSVSRMIIGKSALMARILERIEQVAPTKASVLISGESGVGKELVADAIHNKSNRKNGPFIKVHCAALTKSLLESELFGHEKGAFTGASQQKKGRFELADGGTIFLDEIGEIDQSTQIKLLRVLQEKTFERVGGEKSIEVDVRIVSATNKDLRQEVKAGNFREDLFFRLNVINVEVPPLRDRKEDIPLLCSSFIKEFAKENDKNIEGMDPKVRMALINYSWPGNVRELRNVLEAAVVLSRTNILTLEDLPDNIKNEEDSQYIKVPLGASFSDMEKKLIQATLLHEKGNKSRTAEILGIGRKTLHRKIEEYGLEKEFMVKTH